MKIKLAVEQIYLDDQTKLLWGDAMECIEEIPQNLIQTVITSPTYWGKRRFTSDPKEFGSEKLEKYVDKNVELFTSILEKMKKEGSLFIIIQDTYMGSGVSRSHHNHWVSGTKFLRNGINSNGQGNTSSVTAHHKVIKNKSLSGIPYRIALRLVDSGYIWREQIIWEKPNPMPENVKDRTRQSMEVILHFVKSGKYKFNPEPYQVSTKEGQKRMDNQVWVYAPEPREGHTATFPPKMVKRLMLSTSDEGDTIFEPFLGSGTMLDLSLEHKRKFIGCDINKGFVDQVRNRILGSVESKAEIPQKRITSRVNSSNQKCPENLPE